MNTELPSLIENDNITLPEALINTEKMYNMKALKKKYDGKIKYRKDGRQCYVYIGRVQVPAKNIDELWEKLYEREYGVQNYTMSELFPLWLNWKHANTPINSQTLKIYIQQWNKYFIQYPIINIPVKKLSAKDFINLYRLWTAKRELTSKKFNNLKSLINGLYSFAISELEIVEYNPAKEIDMRQFPLKAPACNDKDKRFDENERELLLNHLANNNDIYALAIQFDFHVTMRIGELLALKWENYRNGQIYISGQRLRSTDMNEDLSFEQNTYETVDYVKGHTECGFRYIPLTKEAQKILERVQEQNPHGEYIFMRNQKQLYPNKFNKQLAKYCAELEIPKRTSHAIRFTVASILYRNGLPATEIQKLLGHSKLSMTLHYLRSIVPNDVTANIMENCLG